jgi:hypothetical protein
VRHISLPKWIENECEVGFTILELFCLMLTWFGDSVLMKGACIFPQWQQVYILTWFSFFVDDQRLKQIVKFKVFALATADNFPRNFIPGLYPPKMPLNILMLKETEGCIFKNQEFMHQSDLTMPSIS